MAKLDLDKDTYRALLAYADQRSRAKGRAVGFREAIADLVDWYVSGADPTAPAAPTGRPADDRPDVMPRAADNSDRRRAGQGRGGGHPLAP